MHHSFVLEFLRPMQRQLFEASFLEKYFTKSRMHEFKQCCWNVVQFSAIWITILASGTHVTVVFLFLSLALLTAPKWEKQIVFSIQDLLRSGGKQDLKGSQIGAFYRWPANLLCGDEQNRAFDALPAFFISTTVPLLGQRRILHWNKRTYKYGLPEIWF